MKVKNSIVEINKEQRKKVCEKVKERVVWNVEKNMNE